MLLSFFFHDVLEQLKANVPTNFYFERVLRCFVTTVSLVSLCLMRHSWRPRDVRNKKVEKVTYIGGGGERVGILLCEQLSYIRKKCYFTLMFMSSSRDEFTLSYQNSVTDVSSLFLLGCSRHVGAPIRSSINLITNTVEALLATTLVSDQLQLRPPM